MSIVTAPFDWTEGYSVNIVDLDRQHQKLLAILHDFNGALSTEAAMQLRMEFWWSWRITREFICCRGGFDGQTWFHRTSNPSDGTRRLQGKDR